MHSVNLPSLPSQYSIQIVRSDGHWMRQYFDGDRSRIESYGPYGHGSTTIGRLDLGLSWRFQPNSQIALQVPVSRETLQRIARPEQDLSWEIGSVLEVQGRSTTEYRGRFLDSPERVSKLIYFDHEHGLPLLTITFNKLGHKALEITAREIRVGPVDSSLFELPDTYTVQTVPAPRNRKRDG